MLTDMASVTQFLEMLSQALNSVGQGNNRALILLFALLVLGEFGVPFPFVLAGMLFFIGYQISQGPFNAIPLATVLILGEQFGAAIVYWLARLLGGRFIAWFERHFRRTKDGLERVKERLHGKAPLAVAVARCIPGLLVPTSLASGIIGVHYRHFALGVLLSTFIWCGTLVASGILVGHGVHHFSIVPHWLAVFAVAVVVCLMWATGLMVSRIRS